MDLQRRSSGTAKAGLATGIVGSSLGALALLGNGANALNNLGAATQTIVPTCATSCMPMNGCGCCSEDHNVNRYEANQAGRIAELETQIALRDANIYNDQKSLEMYKYVDGQLKDIRQTLCDQAVKNQATADSFQMVNERMACLRTDMNNQIEQERHERCCADNSIVNYVNSTFYPKQVADVTTGTTTVAQTTYNPLPSECCDCKRAC